METSRVTQKGNKRWHGVVALLLFICSTSGPPLSTHGKVLISQAQNFLSCKHAQANTAGEFACIDADIGGTMSACQDTERAQRGAWMPQIDFNDA